MKKIKVTFLFLCVVYLAQASSINDALDLNFSIQIDTDSLDYHIKNMKNMSLTADRGLMHANKALRLAKKKELILEQKEIIGYKTYFFVNLKKYDSVIHTSKKYLKFLKKDNIKGLAKQYSILGYYYNANSQRDSAYYCYNYSNEMYEALKDSAKTGENLTRMAIIQAELGDYDGSDDTALKAIEYIDKNNNRYLTTLYNCLAINSKNQKDYKESIYWNTKSLSIATTRLDSISILYNKALALRYLEKYDESINLFKELLNEPKLNERPRTKAKIIDNNAYTIWLQNNKSNVLSDFLTAKNIRQKEKDSFGLIASYAHISDFYKQKNKKKAINNAQKMYNLACRQKSPRDQLEALQKLINLENPLKVKEYYTSYIRINDSINNSEKQAKNKFAKLKYDSEKNREDNLKLKIANSKKEVDLQKEKTQNIIGAVTTGLILLGFTGFGFYRKQKHKLEKREEVYKTETKIAKKIHDEVANNVVNIMNKIQYTNEPKEILLDDLQKVYLLTRDISHQNNIIETGKGFVNSLKNLLTNFNTNSTKIILKNINKVGLESLSETFQIEVYRVLQELMINMQKHSKAKFVALSFEKEKNTINIKYSDNGVGVDLNNLKNKNGLINVETRINSIGGFVTFESSYNNGFKASIKFKG
ncbi:tetratricopeptide repeat-containing sensor histidine kinase [uncultured Lutibacter sp.]|uniref:tetratricopeptide repeat-containing sensor histidine kinase n=1 Tax=uncultured Lutibacter sp. TaxID=437739 RepID=UPI00260399F4|nr:tetratricopeptide repeat-containing sensor histidine kinase [uncultured Lutibacter sp.]